MSGDGTNLGIDSERALATILGGDPAPSEAEEQTPEQVRARIATAFPNSYSGATDCLTRALLRLFEQREETQVWPTDPDCAWPNGYDSPPEFTGPDLSAAVQEVMTDVERDAYNDCTGFMWGFAVNQARWLIGQHPGTNPALITVNVPDSPTT